MEVYKSKTGTKDGICWFFKIRYINIEGTSNQKHSKKYATKKKQKQLSLLLK